MELAAVDIWPVLLPVIVGGVIASVGGLLAPLVAHLASDRASSKRRRQERFEEMFGLVYEHDAWLSRCRGIRVYGNAGDEGPDPLPRALVIASLDFPVLLPVLLEVSNTASGYELWMHQGSHKRLQAKIAELNDGMMEAYQPYLSAVRTLEKRFRDFASRELR